MPRFDITIAGELNLDLILYGLPETLVPERELLADRMMLTLGSSSAIVAHNLAALGSRVGFQSRIGDDPLGPARRVVQDVAGEDLVEDDDCENPEHGKRDPVLPGVYGKADRFVRDVEAAVGAEDMVCARFTFRSSAHLSAACYLIACSLS